jgi:tetratricopeptide (TPR) repeat protein
MFITSVTIFKLITFLPPMEESAPQQPELIGREKELDGLNEALDAAVSGNGSTLLVSGEAGLGKTRLLEEFLGTAGVRDVRILTGGALADVSQPFLVFSKALEGEVDESLFEEHEFKSFAKIFAVNKAGMLMAEASSEEADMDADIFAGMLSAVQNFVKDSLDQAVEQKTGLGRLEYGDMKILIEHGQNLFLTAVFRGAEHDDMRGLLKRTVQSMEEEHVSILESWSGSMQEVTPIQEEVDSLTESRFLVKKDLEGVKLDNERVRISDKVLESLKDLSNDHPLLVILEDLHWADESSLFVLNYIARNIGDERILLLGTFRPGESPIFKTALEGMREERTVEELALQKLGEESVSRLAEEVYPGHGFPETLIENLAAQCEGNPFFIKEMLWQMGEEGSIVRDEEKYLLVNEDYSIPDSVQEVVQKRLGSLDAGTIALAEYVSCIGKEFDDDLALSYEYGKDVPAALVTLKDRGIVLVKDNTMQFSHAIYQDFIYSSIGERWKRAYHKNLGEYYENVYRSNPDEVMYELARHYSRSGDPEKGFDYSTRAGEKAVASFATEKAMELYESSLALAEKMPGNSEVESMVPVVKERLGDLYTVSGIYEKALASFTSAYEQIEEKHDKARMLRKRADVLEKFGKYHESFSQLDAAESLLSPKDSLEAGRISVQRAFLHTRKGEYTDAIKLANESCDLLAGNEEISHVKETAKALHIIGLCHWYEGKYSSSLETNYKSLELMQKIGDLRGVAAASNSIGLIHTEKAEYAEAIKWFEKALALRKSTGDIQGYGMTYSNIGRVHIRKGDFPTGLKYYKEALNIGERIGDKFYVATVYNNLGIMYLRKDDYSKAREYFESSLAIRLKLGDQEGIAISYNNIAEVLTGLGKYDEAIETHHKSMEICRAIGNDDTQTYNFYGLATAHLDLEQIDEAEKNCLEGYNIAKEIGAKEMELCFLHLMGVIERERGNWDESETIFQTAYDGFIESGKEPDAAETNYEYSVLLMRKGDREGAKQKLLEAREVFLQGGFTNWTEKCNRMLEEL